MNLQFFLLVFAALGFGYFLLGLYASKNINTNEDYFLAGRSLGFFPLTCTLIATHLGGAMILGTGLEAYSVGLWGVLYNLGICAGLLVLGLGFASKLREFNVSTTAELFETRYGSVSLRKVASALSAISLTGILCALVVATRGAFLGLGIESEIILLLFWAFIIGYTMIGGLKAVVLTDIAQVLFILILFTLILLYLVFGIGLPMDDVFSHARLFDESKVTFSALFGFFLMPFLFSFVEQDLAQRFFAAKTKKIAVYSALASGIFLMLFSLVPVVLAMQTKILGITVPQGANPVISLLEHFLGDLALTFVMCAIFAAIMSTADSLLCAISSNIAQDFSFDFLGIKDKLALSKWITLISGLVAVGIGYFFYDVLEIIKQSYEVAIGCLFIPVMVCFFTHRKHSSWSAAGSMIGGAICFVMTRFLLLPIARELVVLAVSAIGFVLGAMLSRYSDKINKGDRQTDSKPVR